MSVDGDWNVSLKSPMGNQEATLTLVSDGASLSGKMVGAQGTQEFEGGTIDGNQLSWNVKLTQPMPIQLDFAAEVDGDAIAGKAKLGAFGEATFSGTRA